MQETLILTPPEFHLLTQEIAGCGFYTPQPLKGLALRHTKSIKLTTRPHYLFEQPLQKQFSRRHFGTEFLYYGTKHPFKRLTWKREGESIDAIRNGLNWQVHYTGPAEYGHPFYEAILLAAPTRFNPASALVLALQRGMSAGHNWRKLKREEREAFLRKTIHGWAVANLPEAAFALYLSDKHYVRQSVKTRFKPPEITIALRRLMAEVKPFALQSLTA